MQQSASDHDNTSAEDVANPSSHHRHTDFRPHINTAACDTYRAEEQQIAYIRSGLGGWTGWGLRPILTTSNDGIRLMKQ